MAEQTDEVVTHTPGPWFTHWEPDVTGYPGFYIHGMSGPDKWNKPVLDANARLIAAAPELLAALKLLYREMELSGNAGSKDYGWPKAVTKSREAIAKAEGASRDQ